MIENAFDEMSNNAADGEVQVIRIPAEECGLVEFIAEGITELFDVLRDTTPPELVDLLPAEDAVIGPKLIVRAEFSEPINSETVNPFSFYVGATYPGFEIELPVEGIFEFEQDGKIVLFYASTSLPPGTMIRIRIGPTEFGTIEDIAGNALCTVTERIVYNGEKAKPKILSVTLKGMRNSISWDDNLDEEKIPNTERRTLRVFPESRSAVGLIKKYTRKREGGKCIYTVTLVGRIENIDKDEFKDGEAVADSIIGAGKEEEHKRRSFKVVSNTAGAEELVIESKDWVRLKENTRILLLTLPRDTVKVIVKLDQVAVEDETVFLRAFDVDDLSANTEPLDDESEEEDNKGDKPAKHGKLDNEGTDKVAETVVKKNSNTAEVKFQVTTQPGDNFRVVAYLASEKQRGFLANNLRNQDNPDGINVIDTTTGQSVPDSNITKLLSVWRRLHIELDSMAKPAPEKLKVKGKVTAVKQVGNNWEASLTTDIKVEDGSKDRFQGGKLTIKKAAADGSDVIVPVLLNTEVVGKNITVTVSQNPNPTNKRLPLDFELVDDDDPNVLPKLPDSSRLEPEFKRAFVLVVEVKEAQDKDCNFLENLYPGEVERWTDSEKAFLFSKKQLVSRPSFWAVYIQSAFQPEVDGDGDPDSEVQQKGWVLGLASEKSGNVSFIFRECLRDGKCEQNEKDTVLHELGHIFHSTHEDSGIMDEHFQSGTQYTDETLDKIRRDSSGPIDLMLKVPK
ncbi:MAG: Ig-like domain-containing protein [Planctomycetota bacterium]|nr:Ig-like domain-containing protein [Planctomycetota bacterium]